MTVDQVLKLSLFPATSIATVVNQLSPGIGFGIPCVFETVFGIECFGCGMTRAIMSIWHGNILESFGYHKLGVVVFVILGYMSLREVLVITTLLNRDKFHVRIHAN